MVGRTKEINELTRLYESSESEFVAVYGRRRVGKTYLVRGLSLAQNIDRPGFAPRCAARRCATCSGSPMRRRRTA